MEAHLSFFNFYPQEPYLPFWHQDFPMGMKVVNWTYRVLTIVIYPNGCWSEVFEPP